MGVPGGGEVPLGVPAGVAASIFGKVQPHDPVIILGEGEGLVPNLALPPAKRCNVGQVKSLLGPRFLCALGAKLLPLLVVVRIGNM